MQVNGNAAPVRYNNGYGRISPRNCFQGGQSTNCRVNNLIFPTGLDAITSHSEPRSLGPTAHLSIVEKGMAIVSGRGPVGVGDEGAAVPRRH